LPCVESFFPSHVLPCPLCPSVLCPACPVRLLRNDSITQLIVKKSLHWFVAAETETRTLNPQIQPHCGRRNWLGEGETGAASHVWAIKRRHSLSWLLLPLDWTELNCWFILLGLRCARHWVDPFMAISFAFLLPFVFFSLRCHFFYTSFKGYKATKMLHDHNEWMLISSSHLQRPTSFYRINLPLKRSIDLRPNLWVGGKTLC